MDSHNDYKNHNVCGVLLALLRAFILDPIRFLVEPVKVLAVCRVLNMKRAVILYLLCLIWNIVVKG